MSKEKKGRGQLLAELGALSRDNAGLGLLVHQAIAEQFGLGPTDLKALDLARQEQPLTAGRLAEITGLSTSAVTALLDRLESRGFIERRRDTEDRRKVYVVATGRRDAEVGRVFGPLATAMTAALAHYDDDQLALIVDYLQKTNRAARDVLSALSRPAAPKAPPPRRRSAGPRQGRKAR